MDSDILTVELDLVEVRKWLRGDADHDYLQQELDKAVRVYERGFAHRHRDPKEVENASKSR